ATISRFLPDGTPDPSFHGTGEVYLDRVDSLYPFGGWLTVLPDGTILAVGKIDPDVRPNSIFLERVSADGNAVTVRTASASAFPGLVLFAAPFWDPPGLIAAVNPDTGDVYLVGGNTEATPEADGGIVVYRL